MNLENIRFVTMPISKNNRKDFCTVINYGTLNGDYLEYETKEGLIRKHIKSFGDSIKILSPFEIDYDKSIYQWRKKGDYRPVVLDPSIETGEVYRCNAWHFGLMIDSSGDIIKVRPDL